MHDPAPTADRIRVADSSALAQGNDTTSESGTGKPSSEDAGECHELVHELVENGRGNVEVIA